MAKKTAAPTTALPSLTRAERRILTLALSEFILTQAANRRRAIRGAVIAERIGNDHGVEAFHTAQDAATHYINRINSLLQRIENAG